MARELAEYRRLFIIHDPFTYNAMLGAGIAKPGREKPRCRRAGRAWECEGRGVYAIGDTVEIAYQRWAERALR